ncbi:MAG: cysteine dioxygenase family protein [Flavobacteriales bacterium]|nr:cysteine dioxygenase family protein [Flavobacteriales bacterium]HPF90146.1 cysteine dioxygenase family protein [Flavobacteriales bacterium]
MPVEPMSSVSTPLTSVGELVRELLREPCPELFGRIMARYDTASLDLLPYLKWDPSNYTRNCVVRNARFELLVICFEPGQRTSIHDYDSETAWIRVLGGELVTERFELVDDGALRLRKASRFSTGELMALSRSSSIHRFQNQGSTRAFTLNLYAPPMRKWRVFDERTGADQVRPAGPTG